MPNAFATLALWIWVPLSIILFHMLRPSLAACISIVGGTLLLPSAISFNAVGLPSLGRNEFAVLGLLVGLVSRRWQLLWAMPTCWLW